MVFSILEQWLGRSLPQRPDLHFLMYTRNGCHLCEYAWGILIAHQKIRGFSLEKKDVEAAPVLVAQYGNCVPVVVVNGDVRFRGRVNEVLLRRILDAKR